jgi:hemolysin III
MTPTTGSIRLADLHASALAPRKSATARTAVLPTDSIAGFAKAAIASAATLDVQPAIPGLKIAAKVAQSLKRPAQPTRTAAEELHEERVNAVTHALGLAISGAGFVYLLASATVTGDWLRLTTCGVYGASLVLMYAASTLLHAVQTPAAKLRCQLFDHVAIYLLIAGTYTAFLGGLIQGLVGFALLACVWGLAGVGIAIKVKNAERLEQTSPLPCVGLGWMGLLVIKSLLVVLPPVGMALLVGGGVFFSAGVLFYCRDDKRYFHAIWHLFVMAGTACHFAAILNYVAA